MKFKYWLTRATRFSLYSAQCLPSKLYERLNCIIQWSASCFPCVATLVTRTSSPRSIWSHWLSMSLFSLAAQSPEPLLSVCVFNLARSGPFFDPATEEAKNAVSDTWPLSKPSRREQPYSGTKVLRLVLNVYNHHQHHHHHHHHDHDRRHHHYQHHHYHYHHHHNHHHHHYSVQRSSVCRGNIQISLLKTYSEFRIIISITLSLRYISLSQHICRSTKGLKTPRSAFSSKGKDEKLDLTKQIIRMQRMCNVKALILRN